MGNMGFFVARDRPQKRKKGPKKKHPHVVVYDVMYIDTPIDYTRRGDSSSFSTKTTCLCKLNEGGEHNATKRERERERGSEDTDFPYIHVFGGWESRGVGGRKGKGQLHVFVNTRARGACPPSAAAVKIHAYYRPG